MVTRRHGDTVKGNQKHQRGRLLARHLSLVTCYSSFVVGHSSFTHLRLYRL